MLEPIIVLGSVPDLPKRMSPKAIGPIPSFNPHFLLPFPRKNADFSFQSRRRWKNRPGK